MRQYALCPRQGASRRTRRTTRSSASRSRARTSRPRSTAQEDFCTDVKVPGMVHGRMIRPAVAGAVPVKVDEGSIKDIPGAKVVWDKGFLGVVADKEWDAIKAAQTAQGRMVGRQAAVPGSGRALRPHPQGPGAQARGRRQAGRQCRRRVQDRGARDRGRVRMAVPVACLHGPGLRRWSRSRTATSPAGPARRSRTSCRTASPRTLGVPVEKVRSIWVVGPGSYGRSDADDCRDGRRRAGEGGRPAGARAIHARAGRPAGTRRARPRSTAPAPRSTPPATSSPTSSPARASRAST